MQTVKVDKATLFERVTENRKTHVEEFVEAYSEWQTRFTAALHTLADKAAMASEKKRLDIRNELFKIQQELPQPESHEKDYDLVLSMLDLSVDDTITLSAVDFRRYVQDEWEWKDTFMATTANYKSNF